MTETDCQMAAPSGVSVATDEKHTNTAGRDRVRERLLGVPVVSCDVLVVGGGAAGTRAAATAAAAGAHTVMALKGEVGTSGSTCYRTRSPHGSAYQCADGCSEADGDSPDLHYQDILDAALGMADPRLARILADEAPERLRELITWGFVADPEPDAARGRPHWSGYSCLATKPRAHGIWDVTAGHAGALVLAAQTEMERHGVDVLPHTAIADLLVQDGACVGALAVDAAGEPLVIRAGAVILGSGGAGQLFPQATASHEATGDGYAMALRTGTELVNMEFMQFMLRGQPNAGPSLWMLCPELRNAAGEPVLERYLPAGVSLEDAFETRTLHYPFSTRDPSGWVDIAIRCEALTGRGEGRSGAITLDYGVPRSVARARAGLRSRPQHHWPGPAAGPVVLPERAGKVVHAAHAINGGVPIEPDAASPQPGLYAAGEASAGAHGADRLGGNMLPNTQVFGSRGGLAAAARARTGQAPLRAETLSAPLERVRRLAAQDGSLRANEVKHELQATVARSLFVVRSAQTLADLLEETQRLRHEALPALRVRDRAGLVAALELDNLLLVAEAMGRAALARTESRGGHFRLDYPMQDDARWLTTLRVSWRDGVLSVHPDGQNGTDKFGSGRGCEDMR